MPIDASSGTDYNVAFRGPMGRARAGSSEWRVWSAAGGRSWSLEHLLRGKADSDSTISHANTRCAFARRMGAGRELFGRFDFRHDDPLALERRHPLRRPKIAVAIVQMCPKKRLGEACSRHARRSHLDLASRTFVVASKGVTK